jgi:hypothetical protein
VSGADPWAKGEAHAFHIRATGAPQEVLRESVKLLNDDIRRGGARGAIFGREPAHEGVDLIVERAVFMTLKEGERRLFVLADERKKRAATEGRLPSEALMHHDPKAIKISALVYEPGVVKLLRRHIKRCPHGPLRLSPAHEGALSGLLDFGDPKVEQLYADPSLMDLIKDKHVLWLDVTVYHPKRVRLLKRLCDPSDDLQRQQQRELWLRLSLDKLVQRHTHKELWDHKGLTTGRDAIIDDRERVWVTEAAEDLGLTLKELNDLWVRARVEGELLDGHLSARDIEI